MMLQFSKNSLNKIGCMIFLVGLNPEFDQVRIQVIRKPDNPRSNEVVAIIRSEESRRGLMLDSPSNDASAMVVDGNSNLTGQAAKNQNSENGKLGQGGP